MITPEILRAEAALAGLSDEQVNAIITIGTNDTRAEIDKAFGETYRRMDATIEANTGIKRNGDEKTYDYLDRATKAQKELIDPLNTKVASLEADKTRLEAEIAKGGDAALKSQLESVQTELQNAKTEYAKLQANMASAEKRHKTEIFGLTVGAEINAAASGLKFKPEIPESATKILLQSAIAKVTGMNPEYIDNGQGGKRLIFKGADGATLNNPNNQLNPYTAEELLRNELKDLLDTKRTQEGAGGPGAGSGSGAGVIDVSNARTQVEADDLISKALLAQGIAIGSQAYQDAKDKAWKENNVSKLPLK